MPLRRCLDCDFWAVENGARCVGHTRMRTRAKWAPHHGQLADDFETKLIERRFAAGAALVMLGSSCSGAAPPDLSLPSAASATNSEVSADTDAGIIDPESPSTTPVATTTEGSPSSTSPTGAECDRSLVNLQGQTVAEVAESSPVIAAVLAGSPEEMRAAFAVGDVNEVDEALLLTPLIASINAGCHEHFDALLEAGADPNLEPAEGYPPILAAIRADAEHALNALISAAEGDPALLRPHDVGIEPASHHDVYEQRSVLTNRTDPWSLLSGGATSFGWRTMNPP